MKRVTFVRGQIRRDKFFFPCLVNQQRVKNVVLDTGAFDFVLSDSIAGQLRLVREKAVVVRGVSGSARAWTSHCNLTVGKEKFVNVPCIIMQDLPFEALFGLRFFVDHGYQLLLDPKTATLSFLR
ncbi:retroviral-like aspartic protease family protein [Alicyclobacillus sp. ALC3]|nr:retroviral-like aspartic protease family protein [Alicyclobacillus sp. ALC3]